MEKGCQELFPWQGRGLRELSWVLCMGMGGRSCPGLADKERILGQRKLRDGCYPSKGLCFFSFCFVYQPPPYLRARSRHL